MLLKVHPEILVPFRLIQKFEISVLSMVKVKKINIAVTYLECHYFFSGHWHNHFRQPGQGAARAGGTCQQAVLLIPCLYDVSNQWSTLFLFFFFQLSTETKRGEWKMVFPHYVHKWDDSLCGLYYKTFRIVIYERKLCSSLECKLRSYDRNPSYG